MTARSDMAAAGLRLLDLLTVSEAAQMIGCGPDTVTRLAAAGVLERVMLGAFVRITPESVAAYNQRMAAGPGRSS